MRGGGAHLGVQLIASHHVAERKKHTGEQQHQKKQTDDVPPFQNAFPRAGFPASHCLFSYSAQTLDPAINNIYGQRKHNRCVLLDTYLGQSLQIAQLDSGLLRLKNFGGVSEFLRSFELTVSVNDFGAAFAFGFGLASDGALHLFGNVHLLDFDFGDLDAPGFGILIENDLQFAVDIVTLGENFVQVKLSDHTAQRGLRQLRSGILKICDLRQRQIGIHNAEVTYRVYFNGDVVVSDDVLRRNVERFEAQTDAIKGFDGPENKIHSAAFGLRQQTSEPKNYTAFPFFDDIKRVLDPNQKHQNYKCDAQ